MELSACPTRHNAPFRFLDLPREIRLLCYEFIPENITHYIITDADCSIAVSDKCFNPAILATCHTIYEEAREVLYNQLYHDGPQVSMAYRGSSTDSLIFILEHGLLPHLPSEQRCYPSSKDGIARHTIERCIRFDTSLFNLRSYMRSRKDHELHINWQPVRGGLTEREFLSRFVKDIARLYVLISNRPYTVSIQEGDRLIPLEDFVHRRIKGFGREFQRRLASDGLISWIDILLRDSRARRTSEWLWPRPR